MLLQVPFMVLVLPMVCILVTTKGGKRVKQKFFRFFLGWQRPWKERDVLNATEMR
jgi:hypothetical protein